MSAAHANNFDFLRQLAALLVLWSHQHALMGVAERNPLSFQTWGGLGVLMFFCISGYLVTQSWTQDPHALRFTLRRVLRIWPALLLVVLLTIFLLGPVATRLPLADYWASRDTWGYFAVLKLAVNRTLPGVFEGGPYPGAVNGSLWSYPYEVRWYLVLGLLGLVGLLRRRWALPLVLLGVAWTSFVVYRAGQVPEHKWGFELGAFFLAGAVLFQWRDAWQPRAKAVAVVLGAAALLFAATGWPYAALLCVLPFAIAWIGTAATPFVRQAGRFGDPSYGLYLFAFPIQQLVITSSQGALGFWPALALCVAATYALAYASWHLVERPALGLKRHLVRPSATPSATMAAGPSSP